MKTNTHKILSSILLLGLLLGISSFLIKPEGESKVEWLSFEEALKKNENHKRKIFVDVYTDWCGWCKVMDKKSFSNAKVADYLNKKFYAVKLNAESNKSFVYKGKTVTEAEMAQRVLGVSSFPTTVYLSEEADGLTTLPGFLEADVLLKVLRYYGEDFYKTKSWEDYQAMSK
jgi:thioredoxin-related protein